MKIVTLITFCLLLGFKAGFSQIAYSGTLTGRILTSDGKPAESVSITLKGTKISHFTQANGKFSIKTPEGNYTLIVQALGLTEQEFSVRINAGQITEIPEITLKESALQLQEVVLTGQYGPQSLRNSVQRVRTISNERIRLKGATDVLGVLNTELGVRFSNDLTLGETDVQIMGMSGQNVKVLVDGVPIVDRGATKQSLSQLDINTIDRIEIVEGPMSVVYGTDALAGVINIITKKGNSGKTLSIAARVQEETVGKEYNGFSNDGVHNQNLNVNWANKGWEIAAGGTRNTNGGWQGDNTGRMKAWRPKNQLLGNTRLGYQADNFSVRYLLDALDENIKALGNINTSTNKTTDAEYKTTRLNHQVQADWNIANNLSLNGVVSYQDYSRRTLTTDVDFTTGKRTLNVGEGAQDISGFTSKFLRSTLQYKLSPSVALQPGIDIKLDGATGQRITGAPSINDYSLFTTSEINLKSKGAISLISFKPGLRLSKNSIYDAPPVIPSLSSKITLFSDFDLRLSYARGFRSPALRELYFNFFDASHSIKGNENLKAERSNSYNGSLSWQAVNKPSLRINSTITGFYNQYKDQIAYGIDPSNTTISMPVNIDKFETTGTTIDNIFHWKNSFQASVGFSYIGRYNMYHDTENTIPRFMWTPEVNTNLTWFIKKANANINVSYKYSGVKPIYEVVTVSGAQQIRQAQTAGFSMADLGFSKKLNAAVTLNGGMRNIFNVTTLSNTSQESGGAHSTAGSVPMGYGRSYFLGLNFEFTKN